MSLLDDPALILPHHLDQKVQSGVGGLYPTGRTLEPVRVRLLPTSVFVRDLGVPAGAEGEVRGRYMQDGVKRLNVWIEGTGMLFGVPVGEVRRR